MTTRAVHLEMAYSMETDVFLNAFLRFTCRRGIPATVLSDNGSNFVGANREFKSLVEGLDQNQVLEKATNNKICWKFNPPGAPHWGGVFESMVKCAKHALQSIMSPGEIDDEELETLFCGVESLLNSRPLTYQSDDPHDANPLTPSHFLTGLIGGQYAPEVHGDAKFNLRVQCLLNSFWIRWMKEILPTLQPRRKWNTKQKDLKVDA
jgi:hypothetical protein